jgi:hypothetical protein
MEPLHADHVRTYQEFLPSTHPALFSCRAFERETVESEEAGFQIAASSNPSQMTFLSLPIDRQVFEIPDQRTNKISLP